MSVRAARFACALMSRSMSVLRSEVEMITMHVHQSPSHQQECARKRSQGSPRSAVLNRVVPAEIMARCASQSVTAQVRDVGHEPRGVADAQRPVAQRLYAAFGQPPTGFDLP